MSKKYNIVSKNDEDNEIIIEKEKGKLASFFKRYNKSIILALFLLTITIGVVAVYVTTSNFGQSTEPLYKDLNIDFNDEDDVVVNDNSNDSDNDNNNVVNNDNASVIIEQEKNNSLKNEGISFVNKEVKKTLLSIYYLSDGTVLMKRLGIIYRVSARKDGSYGVNDKGEIYSDVYFKIVLLHYKKNYDFGSVEYYSDGSSMIFSDEVNMFVRNSSSINTDYIGNNKVSYIKEVKNVGGYTITKYLSGLINITGNNKDYIIYKDDDYEINGNDISFKYHNEASVIDTKEYNNGIKIKYYSDGAAIIYKNNNYISIRRSNAIKINNNNFIEILDNDYVTKTKIVDISNGKIYYFSNGSAIISYNNGDDIYAINNESIRYENDDLKEIDGDIIKKSDLRQLNGNTLEYFDDIVYVKLNDGQEVITNKTNINSSGSIKKEISKKVGKYTFTNDSKKTIHYRIVIEQSNNTTIDPSFVNYTLDVDNNIKSGIITDNVWNIGSQLSGGKTIENNSYVLYDGVVGPLTDVSINLLLYYDYTNMTNDMMDKWFKGTFKIYGWEEES